MPPNPPGSSWGSTAPRIQAYYEFLDFFKASRLYAVQFRKPGDYAKLLYNLDSINIRNSCRISFKDFTGVFNFNHISDFRFW